MNSFITLMYHNVTPNGAEYSDLSPSVTAYFVDQRTFSAHLLEVCQRGHCVDTKAIAGFYQQKSVNVPDVLTLVQVTFDDGWAGSYETAGPILETHGCQGLLFVTTDLIGSRHCVSLNDLKRIDPVVMTIGSHAKTHRFLNRMSESEIREELSFSKSHLEDAVGYEVDTLSIPGGAIDERVRKIASDVGYRFVYTSETYANTRHRGSLNIGRIAIKNTTTIDDVRRYVKGDLRKERLRRGLLSIPKRLLGQHGYHALRRRVLREAESQEEMVDLSGAQVS
ncbi:MAG: hypothetical protein CMJ78_16285 [Planctomycetaceae bacterium]|nr:hypothetical protein [Planctomycetaceae bacterium]